MCDKSATASARSKKEAKQKVASALLTQLAQAGLSVPAPWGLQGPQEMAAGPAPRCYVALLQVRQIKRLMTVPNLGRYNLASSLSFGSFFCQDKRP